jgi:hypothetical protein
MSDKFYGWLLGLTYGAIVICIGYGMAQEPTRAPKAKPQPIEASPGPQCTFIWPRGFVLPASTTVIAKKGKLKGQKFEVPPYICKNGDLEATWRNCTQRYST